MILKNHIAYRFLTDDSLYYEMMLKFMPGPIKKIEEGLDISEEESSRLHTLNHTLSPLDQRAYYIADTVVDKIDLLKLKKKQDGHYDWTVFNGLKDQKMTFIYSNNSLIRFCVYKGFLCFCLMESSKPDEKGRVSLNYHIFHYNQNDNKFSGNWNELNTINVEERIYKLLCFFYLGNNEMVIVEPSKKYGTRKEGKIINTFKDLPITVVNSNWNITSIRTEGFDVRGHFAIRWTGEGRKIPKMVFIEPFKKKGYVRGLKKDKHILKLKN